MAKYTMNTTYMKSGQENNTFHVKKGYKAAKMVKRRGKKDGE